MAVNLHTTRYRFGVDELAESTHGWHAAENVNPTQGVIAVDTTFLLRFTVQETGGTAAANVDNQFQCRLNGGAFQNITTTSTIVKAVAAAAFANGANCTKRLAGTGTFETTAAGCTEDGLSGGASNDIAASGNSETECGLQIVSANVAHNDSIEFRLTSPDFTITNDVVPTITVSEAVPVLVTPGVLTLAIATFAPLVLLPQLVTSGLLALALTTFAPTVTVEAASVTVTPTTAALTTSPFAPTVPVSDNQLVAPGVLAQSTATFAPSVTVGARAVPSTTTLTAATFAPTVLTPRTVTPSLLAATMTTFAPTVTTGKTIVIGVLNLGGSGSGPSPVMVMD